MTKEVVSIIIPVYNSEKYIAQAIESALEQRSDKYKLEILISNNHSTDSTLRIIQSFTETEIQIYSPISFLSVEENWTFLTTKASGIYTKLLCADDLLLEGTLEKEFEILAEHQSCCAVISPRNIISKSGKTILKSRGIRMNGEFQANYVIKKSLDAGTNIFGEPACVLFKTEFLKSHLPWNNKFPLLIDLDMYMRVFQNQLVYIHDKPSSSFRIHGESTTSGLEIAPWKQFNLFARSFLDGNTDFTDDYSFIQIKTKAFIKTLARRLLYRISDLFL